jgi:hypothetical protein
MLCARTVIDVVHLSVATLEDALACLDPTTLHMNPHELAPAGSDPTLRKCAPSRLMSDECESGQLPREKVVLHATASPALKVPDGIGPAGVGFRSSSPDHDPFYHKVMTARKRKLVDALT